MHRRWRGGLGSLLVAGALVFTACSSDAGSDAGARPKADDNVAVTATTAAAGSDSAALCAIFNQLAANGAGRDAAVHRDDAGGLAEADRDQRSDGRGRPRRVA